MESWFINAASGGGRIDRDQMEPGWLLKLVVKEAETGKWLKTDQYRLAQPDKKEAANLSREDSMGWLALLKMAAMLIIDRVLLAATPWPFFLHAKVKAKQATSYFKLGH